MRLQHNLATCCEKVKGEGVAIESWGWRMRRGWILKKRLRGRRFLLRVRGNCYWGRFIVEDALTWQKCLPFRFFYF